MSCPIHLDECKMKKVCFRIRKRYFDDIVAGKKNVEFRRDVPFWRKRVSNLLSMDNVLSALPVLFYRIPLREDVQAVFICGKRVHRRKLRAISRMKTPLDLSDQGKKDLNTKLCFAFHLGEEVIP